MVSLLVGDGKGGYRLTNLFMIHVLCCHMASCFPIGRAWFSSTIPNHVECPRAINKPTHYGPPFPHPPSLALMYPLAGLKGSASTTHRLYSQISLLLIVTY